MIANKNHGTFQILLLAGLSLVFLFLYFLLAHNNRLATDDYFYLYNADQFGIWKGMLASYNTWVTRWTSILFLNCVFKSYHFFNSLIPFHLLTMTTLILVVMNFIQAITKTFFQLTISLFARLLYSLLFISSFFFFSFSIGETWFWTAAMTMYLWSIMLFITGVTIIIKDETSWSKYVLSFGCFFFIGGASESAAINIFILLTAALVFCIYRFRFSIQKSLSDKRTRLLLVAIASLSASLLISYLGEGRVLRASALPHIGLIKALIVSIKTFVKMLLFYLPLKIHWFIFFSVPWIFLGHLYSSDKKETLEKIFRQLFKFVLLFMLLSFVSFIPVSVLLGETGPFRTWILIYLYITLCCICCGFYLGYKFEWNKKLLNRTYVISMTTLVVLIMIHLADQNEITSRYAAAVDQRIDKLRQAKANGETKTIELDPLPPSGMLFSSEISEDSSNFSNQHLKNYLKLKFDITRK